MVHAIITFSTQTSFEGFFGVQCVENLFAPLFFNFSINCVSLY